MAPSHNYSDDLKPLRGKKVVMVFGNLELGGAERQGLLLAQGLKERHGVDVRIWGLQDKEGRLSQMCDDMGIGWHGIDFHWGKTPLTRVASLVKLGWALRRERPDVILSYTAIPNLACGIVWRSTKARLFVWNQRDEGLLLNKKFWHRLAVARTSHYLCNSAAGKEFLESFFGVDPASVSVIRNGVIPHKPKASRAEWRRRLSLTEETAVACMVANIHRDKDHETLLRAWGQLVAGWGETQKPVLLLAGRADKGAERLQALARELRIEREVRFVGAIDDVPGLLGAVDVCVHSSRSEGLPNAVLEAMAAGLPVAGTDIPGIRDALGSAGRDHLAPPGNENELCRHLRTLLENPSLRETAGAMLRQRIETEFSLEEMCKKTASFIAARLRGVQGGTSP